MCHTERQGESIKVSRIRPHTLQDSQVHGQLPSNVLSVIIETALCVGIGSVGVHALGNKHFEKELQSCGQDPQNF